MRQYLNAVREVISSGTLKKNRTGVDTISTFNINYEIDLREGFPLLTTKKMSWKNIVIESLWFLSGKINLELLRKHGCKFWDPWADKYGNVPSAYGNFWRHFPTEIDGDGTLYFLDQIRTAVDELKSNPMSRRIVVSAWSPGNAWFSKLPPCHAMFILNVQIDERGEPILCLHLTQRSCDMGLGVPYNIAGYSFLLHLFSRFTGIKVGIFAHTLVDAHIYVAEKGSENEKFDHLRPLKEQLQRFPTRLPNLIIHRDIQTLEDVQAVIYEETDTILETFKLVDYNPAPAIRMKAAV